MQKNKRALPLLFFTIFVDLLGFGIIIPVLPNYVKYQLGVSEVYVGLIGATYALMQFFFAPVWGSLSDRYGRRPILLISIFLNGLGYIALAFAGSLWSVFFARALSGLGGGNISAAQAYIADITPIHKRAKRMGLIQAAFGLGFIFGPVLGGYLEENFGFPSLGFVAAILCGINLVTSYFILPESLSNEQKQRDAPIRFVPFGEYAKVFRTPLKSRLFITYILYVIAFFNFQITATLIWKEKYSYQEDEIGLIFSYIGVISAAMQLIFIGWFTKRFGEYKLLIAAISILMISLAIMSYVPPPLFIPVELAFLGLLAVANGLFGPSGLSILSQITSSREQGRVLGLYQSFGSMGRVIGPLMGGALYAINMHIPYITGAGILLVSLYLALQIKSMSKRSQSVSLQTLEKK